ncbi:uncharacterized protein LOC135386277 [Ornithodoros turicata]|uniref:uncharacterized protein LOC135386277 n=1 Tax=Ornithodoros turicata TaxID=34597 RepID=UPI003138A60B
MSLARQEISVLLLTFTLAVNGICASEDSEREFILLDPNGEEAKDAAQFAVEAQGVTLVKVNRAEMMFENLQYRIFLDVNVCDEAGSCVLRDCFAHVIQPTQYPERFLKDFLYIRVLCTL